MLPLLQQGTDQFAPWQAWTFVGLGIMGAIYVWVLRPLARRRDPLVKNTPSFASLSRQRDVEKQMQNLLVELSEMSRQISAQLDTRASKLEILIQQADQRIAVLKNSAGFAPQRPESSAPIVETEPPRAEVEEMPDPRHSEVYSLADSGRDAQQIASELNRPRGEVELILALRGKR
ncbi:MAG TPA: hypothetical protein VHD56_12310 [Tepidisphaeraceae bacterium]|nr:hypothetical protein [Tepidisphaeraceae bacterium]